MTTQSFYDALKQLAIPLRLDLDIARARRLVAQLGDSDSDIALMERYLALIDKMANDPASLEARHEARWAWVVAQGKHIDPAWEPTAALIRSLRLGAFSAFAAMVDGELLVCVDDSLETLTQRRMQLFVAAVEPGTSSGRIPGQSFLPLSLAGRLDRLNFARVIDDAPPLDTYDLDLGANGQNIASTLTGTAIRFALAHEYVHWVLGHLVDQGHTVTQSLEFAESPHAAAANETAADILAAQLILECRVQDGEMMVADVEPEVALDRLLAIRLFFSILEAHDEAYWAAPPESHTPPRQRWRDIKQSLNVPGEVESGLVQIERQVALFEEARTAPRDHPESLGDAIRQQSRIYVDPLTADEVLHGMTIDERADLILNGSFTYCLSLLGIVAVGRELIFPDAVKDSAILDLARVSGPIYDELIDHYLWAAIGENILLSTLVSRRRFGELAPLLRPVAGTSVIQWRRNVSKLFESEEHLGWLASGGLKGLQQLDIERAWLSQSTKCLLTSWLIEEGGLPIR